MPITRLINIAIDVIFATNLDRSLAPDGMERDGTTIVTFLAAFVITQGGFVATAIKDAKTPPKLYALLAIYLVLFVLSAIGLIWVLRSTRIDWLKQKRRTFDVATIAYARWVLGSSAVVLCLLGALAWFNLLPGQPTRSTFDGSLASTSSIAGMPTLAATGYASLHDRSQQVMQRWLDALPGAYAGQEVVVIQQVDGFKDDYYPFDVEIQYEDQIIDRSLDVGDRTAFLAKVDEAPTQVTGKFGEYYLPAYRQVPFEFSKDQETLTGRLHVPGANKDERLIVMIAINLKENKPVVGKKDLGKFKLLRKDSQ